MEVGHFDLDDAIADLRSDEGQDPVMLIASMPPWWSSMYVLAFATPN